jgi:pimeloyl-ACP methyl ester carboxylesterase
MLTEFTINVLGLKLAAVRSGNPHGPTILALHGWLDNCLSFQPVSSFLQDFNFIAIDFSGHGLSDYRSPDCYLHFIDYINDLAFIFKELQIQQAFLLGHSLGGSIAALFAGLFPEYVKGVFVIDSLGPVIAPAHQQIIMLQQAKDKYLELMDKKLKVFASIAEAMQARAKASAMKLTSVELLVKRNLKPVHGGFSWKTDPRLLIAPTTGHSEESIQIILSQIRSPISLIIPHHGWPYEAGFFPRRQTYIPHLITHSLPGGHHVHMDSPEIVGPLIKDFFQANN